MRAVLDTSVLIAGDVPAGLERHNVADFRHVADVVRVLRPDDIA